MLFGELIIIGILSFTNNPQITYFVLANLITLIVLMITLYFDKKSSNKIEDVLKTVKRIEEKIDRLDKNNSESKS